MPVEDSSLTGSRKQIPVAGPSITELEVRYVAEAVSQAWYEHANDFHLRFQTAFAERVGRRYALALPSGTAALHLALLRLGVGTGDEVIVPDLTWIATAAPISYVGARAVFVDIDRDSWCIDVGAVERALTHRTRAVIAVDLYGGMPRIKDLEELLADRKIPLIEDAAEALGSTLDGRPAGSFGEIGAFSFHGSKTLTTGEGGMLVTDDESTFERCASLADHARVPGEYGFRRTEVAFKYKMSNMQAALGLAQLERLDELVARKREIFGWYREALASGVEQGLIMLNSEPEGLLNSYWMVSVVLSRACGLTKDGVMLHLRERGIDTRPFFDPLSSLEAYRGALEAEGAIRTNTVSYEIAPYGINLPSALSLTEDDVEYVSEQLLNLLQRRGSATLNPIV